MEEKIYNKIMQDRKNNFEYGFHIGWTQECSIEKLNSKLAPHHIWAFVPRLEEYNGEVFWVLQDNKD